MKSFDISKNFVSYKSDLVIKNEDAAILESIENIIMCDINTVVGNNNLGTNKNSLLFKQNTYATLFSLMIELEQKIIQFEPRVSAVNITLETDSEYNTIEFKIIAQTDSDRILQFNKQLIVNR